MATNAADGSESDPGEPIGALSAAIHSLRERSRALLRMQNSRLKDFESKLEAQLAAAIERLELTPREIGNEEQDLFDRVESLEREIKRLQQLQKESDQALEEARLMLGEMEEERRVLSERLAGAEDKSTGGTANAAPAAASDEAERLSRRLEMAMQEIRELKYQNEELTEKLKQPGGSAAPAAPSGSSGGRFDWESEKLRLIQQLSSGFDTSDPVQAKEKLRCEEVIRATDRAIAEKDREIADLRRQLEERPTIEVAPATDTAATEQILATDEVIQVERERLAAAQAEWQEKLRQAEVEISVERAKIARERLQFEEKLRQMGNQNPGSPGPASDAKTPNRGRWLSRLGLNNNEEE